MDGLNNNKTYETNDFALATTLLSLGFNIDHLDKNNPGRIVFIFNRTNELDLAIKAYWNNKLKVNPKAFFNCQKELKGRIYSSY